MTKLSLTLRYHWKAALGWSLTLLVGAGYALWYSLAPVAQAQGLSQGKPSMVACTVILLQAKDDQCLEIMVPTPDRAVVVCGDGSVGMGLWTISVSARTSTSAWTPSTPTAGATWGCLPT